MKRPKISLCMVNDQSRRDEVISVIEACGFEVNKNEVHVQIDATRKSLEEVADSYDAVIRYFTKQVNAAADAEPTHFYLDWEHDNHLGYSKPESIEEAMFAEALTVMAKRRLPAGVKEGIWNPFILKEAMPASTRTSIETMLQRHVVNPQDFLIVNGNTRGPITPENAVDWVLRLVQGVEIARTFTSLPIYLSFQTRDRPRTGATAFTPESVEAWWKTCTTLQVTPLWWLNAGVDNSQLDARLDEFKAMAPFMHKGINAAVIA